jgi:hypothetical protein
VTRKQWGERRWAALEAAAARLEISVAELVRRLVDDGLGTTCALTLSNNTKSDLESPDSALLRDPKKDPYEERAPGGANESDVGVGEGEKFNFTPIAAAYARAFGVSDELARPLLNPRVSARLAKEACAEYGAADVLAAVEASPFDDWISREFMAKGRWPPLSTVLAPRVISGLVTRVRS